MALVYKIRRKSDGLFSMGGTSPHFNKKGKIWKQRGHLTSHINQLWSAKECKMYIDECEVVTYELVETETGDTLSIADYLEEIATRKADREEAARLRSEAFQRDQRRKQYEALKDEFGE